MITGMRAAIFDLDGVIVDTAKYHYLAWRKLANQLGFDFDLADNEKLKGVSRVRSLEILLKIGGLALDEKQCESLAAQKNAWYVDFIRRMDASEILPGAEEYLRAIRHNGIKTALGSASKNAPLILERLGITPLFDAVIDGTQVLHSKPDAEVFVRAQQALGIAPELCVAFEDAEAGIIAAHAAGMGAVGIGKPGLLQDADMVIDGLYQLNVLSPGLGR